MFPVPASCYLYNLCSSCQVTKTHNMHTGRCKHIARTSATPLFTSSSFPTSMLPRSIPLHQARCLRLNCKPRSLDSGFTVSEVISSDTPGRIGSCTKTSDNTDDDCKVLDALDASTSPFSFAVSRRGILTLLAASFIASAPNNAGAAAKSPAGEWSSPGLNAPENPDLPKFFKTASGVKVQELAPGAAGSVTAKAGDLVLIDYVLRRANGYFIYGTIEGVSFQPKDVPIGPVALRLGSSELIPGLGETLIGMRKGGKRRALVPASEGYFSVPNGCQTLQPQPPTFAAQRQLQNHCTEPMLFEIELLRITPS